MAGRCDALVESLKELGMELHLVEFEKRSDKETANFTVARNGSDFAVKVETGATQNDRFEICEISQTSASYIFFCLLSKVTEIFYEIDGYMRRYVGDKETATALRARKALGKFFRDGLLPYMEIFNPFVCGGPNSVDKTVQETLYCYETILLYGEECRLTVVEEENADTFKFRIHKGRGSNEDTVELRLSDSFDFSFLAGKIRTYVRTTTRFAKWQCDVLDALVDFGGVRCTSSPHFETNSQTFSILLEGSGRTAFFQMHFESGSTTKNYYMLMDEIRSVYSKQYQKFGSELPDLNELAASARNFLKDTRCMSVGYSYASKDRLIKAIDDILELQHQLDETSDKTVLWDLLREIVAHLTAR